MYTITRNVYGSNSGPVWGPGASSGPVWGPGASASSWPVWGPGASSGPVWGPGASSGPGQVRAYLLSSSLCRRGSNVSLVLDMSALGSVEPLSVAVVTPREAVAREYLLSARRPLTRQQLRDIINNTHKLHAEFAVSHDPGHRVRTRTTTGSGFRTNQGQGSELTRVRVQNQPGSEPEPRQG